MRGIMAMLSPGARSPCARAEFSSLGPGADRASPRLAVEGFPVPACSAIRYKLFEVDGRGACYRCHWLTHASRHAHRTCLASIASAGCAFALVPIRARLRRCLSASGTISFHWIVAEIEALERGLVEHLGSINKVLERRARLRGVIPK